MVSIKSLNAFSDLLTRSPQAANNSPVCSDRRSPQYLPRQGVIQSRDIRQVCMVILKHIGMCGDIEFCKCKRKGAKMKENFDG